MLQIARDVNQHVQSKTKEGEQKRAKESSVCLSVCRLPSSAAWCMSFFGIQPTLTQVPPNPHLDPFKIQVD